MTRHLICIMSLVIMLCTQCATAGNRISVSVPHNSQGKREQTEEEAKRLWEQYITAVGGREHLFAVNNVVITSDSQYNTGPIHQVSLSVFPNKFWFWDDLRPSKFGLRVEMHNYETDMTYIITPGDRYSLPHKIVGEKNQFQSNLLYYLPENRWFKPELVRATKGRVGLRAVDIVETKEGNNRADIALDRKTHLPVTITYYHTRDNRLVLDNVLRLSDYVEVNGIKVPQKVKDTDGPEYKISIQFNVEYNEDIFVHPTRIEDGPEAWRPKTKR